MQSLQISSCPRISAIYYALLQCGYDYYPLERSVTETEAIQAFAAYQEKFPFFSHTKQDTCEVYAYWPRAAMLEAASFFINDNYTGFGDFEILQKQIMSAGNIADQEKNAAFWDWLKDFPGALEEVLCSPGFRAYMDWERSWRDKQNDLCSAGLACIQRTLTACVERYHSPVKELQIIINPIKCVYSADYHLLGDKFVFCSGRFSRSSVLHEFLHHAVHPVVEENRHVILQCKVRYPGIDKSYYLTGDDAGQLNAFEEYFVRTLTESADTNALPDKIDIALSELISEGTVI